MYQPGVGVSAPMPKEITLVSEVIVIEGPTSSKIIRKRSGTLLQCNARRCHECSIKKPSSTPAIGSIFQHESSSKFIFISHSCTKD